MPTGVYQRKPMSEETKAKLRAARTGKPLSEEHRMKLSAAKFGKPGPWLGKKRGQLSDEHKRKISAAQKGKAVSDETAAKISAALSGRKRPPEVIEKMRAAALRTARRGPANSRWGKPPAHGIRVRYEGISFRSTFEVRCAKAMNARGIRWEYEPRRFDLGSCTYLPDFYLPDIGAYWEVKGWLGPDSQKKIALFRRLFPEISLVVVTEPVLKQLES